MTAVLPEAVDRTRTVVEPALRAAVEQLSAPLQRVAAYHLGWVEADGSPRPQGSGKALRPALVLLGAAAAGGPAEPAVPAAVAVELVHNFSLLHDDLMDRDVSRRHRPTAWTVFGPAPAILTGDALLALATEMLLDPPAVTGSWPLRCLSAAVQQLIGGQILDVEFEHRLDVTVEQCLAMAAGKTAALMACAASIGALVVGGPGPVALCLADYGRHLGLAFQLVDDLLGIWGRPEVTGKPVLADLRGHKRSAPVVAALRAPGPAAAELARLLADGAPRDDRETGLLARLVEAAGGRGWTEAQADRQLRLALGCLDRVGLTQPAGAELAELGRFAVLRDR